MALLHLNPIHRILFLYSHRQNKKLNVRTAEIQIQGLLLNSVQRHVSRCGIVIVVCSRLNILSAIEG